MISVLYRVALCRLTEGLHTIHENAGINIYDEEQKEFIHKRISCVEHATVGNALINDTIQKRRFIYVLLIDQRYAFGSVSHDLIKINMEQL
jgi:hypothetical protein